MDNQKRRKILLGILSTTICMCLCLLIVFSTHKVGFNSHRADNIGYNAEMNQGTVRIRYVDKNGKSIKSDKFINGDVGSWYETTREHISSYKAFGDEPLNKKGYYSKDESTVTYVYEETDLLSATINENDEINLTVENDRKVAEYDLRVKGISSQDNSKVSDAEFKIKKDSEEIKTGLTNKGELFVGTLTVRDENTTTYTIENVKCKGYKSKATEPFQIKMNKKWNEEKSKYDVTLEYDETNDAVKVEFKNNQIEVTFDFEPITNKYSLQLMTVDEETKMAVPSRFKVKALNVNFDTELSVSDGMEKIGDFELNNQSVEVEYYEISQIDIATGYNKILETPMIIEVRKVFNEVKGKYEVDVVYDESLIYVEVEADDEGVISITVECAKEKPQEEIPQEEKVEYDLGIEYFVSKVNDEEQNREPSYTYNKKDNTLFFAEKKDELSVKNEDKVELTARVYNNSKKDKTGTAVKLNVPAGFVFDKENKLNIENEWQMYIGNDNGILEKTDDAEKATVLVSKKLVKKNIKAIDEENSKLSYEDLAVVFKVTENDLEKDRKFVANAELTSLIDDKDEKNNVNSEYLYVKFFDLQITKYIEKIDINQGDKKATKDVGFDKKDSLTKIEVKSKQVNETTLDITYGIKVKNIGEIEGMALELSDIIPEGLEFVPSKNEDWYKDGTVIKSTILNSEILKPGDEKTVNVVLTWKLDGEKLGTRVNKAKILDYYNESNSQDITGDNISESPIIVTISTGAVIYTGIAVGILCGAAGGYIMIKKSGRKED